MKKKILAFGVALSVMLGMAGCSTAHTVNHNLSKDANEFNIYRRITVTNARTNDWTCYVMEQTEPKGTDKYHYELVFYPERLIPDIEIK